MIDVHRTRRSSGVYSAGMPAVSAGAGGHTGGGFRESLGGQLKEDFRRRVEAILNGLTSLSAELLYKVDIRAFQQYLGQIRSLLSEIIQNAYALSTEHIMDRRGHRRILSAVEVVDEKLSALAGEVLQSNGDKLSYISKVDEIRGLIMDILS